jgi:hypothetical protein
MLTFLIFDKSENAVCFDKSNAKFLVNTFYYRPIHVNLEMAVKAGKSLVGDVRA